MLSSNLLVVGVTLKKIIVKFEENSDTNIFTFLCIKKSIRTPGSHAQPVTMASHNNGI